MTLTQLPVTLRNARRAAGDGNGHGRGASSGWCLRRGDGGVESASARRLGCVHTCPEVRPEVARSADSLLVRALVRAQRDRREAAARALLREASAIRRNAEARAGVTRATEHGLCSACCSHSRKVV